MKKIVPISAAIIILLIAAFFFLRNEDELVTSEETDMELNNGINRSIVHEYKSGNTAENSILVTKTDKGQQNYNITITFNNQQNADIYKIHDLRVQIKPESNVFLESVYYDSNSGSESVYSFTDNTFSANSDDYLFIDLNVKNYFNESVVIDLEYNIGGSLIHPVKNEEYHTQIVV